MFKRISFFGRPAEKTTTLTEAETNCAILVNTKSGGQKGEDIGNHFRTMGISVFPFHEFVQPATSDARYRELSEVIEDGAHIIIAGGDGTNVWGTQVIEECCIRYDLNYPFVCLYPIGTGNDLSRSLGWGNKQPPVQLASCEKMVKNYAEGLGDDHITGLDRWGIHCSFTDKGNTNNCWGRPLPKNFLCYCSIGYDARIAYDFEVERQKNPERFTSQQSNQMAYIYHGTSEFFSPCKPLTSEDVRIWVNGEEMHLPDNIRSLKLLNINSAANGVFFWGSTPSTSDEPCKEWTPPRLDDGKLEMVGSQGARALVGFRVNYGHAFRLAQTKHVVWQILREMEMQVDGEAWIQKPCTIEFFLRDKIPTIVGKTGPRGVDEEISLLQKSGTTSPEVGLKRRETIQNLEEIACRKKNIVIENDSDDEMVQILRGQNPLEPIEQAI